jgi:hypothetical protein
LFGIDGLKNEAAQGHIVQTTILMEQGYCRGKFAKMIPSMQALLQDKRVRKAYHT